MEKIYVSTRDQNRKMTSKQAILEGISKDGGLYVWPDIDSVQIDLHTICEQSYKENAYTILQPLLPDFSEEELKMRMDILFLRRILHLLKKSMMYMY